MNSQQSFGVGSKVTFGKFAADKKNLSAYPKLDTSAASESCRAERAVSQMQQVNETQADQNTSQSSSVLCGADVQNRKPQVGAGRALQSSSKHQQQASRFSGPLRKSSSSNSSSLDSASTEFDYGNKCGKCQNHEIDVLKKGKFAVPL